MVPLSYHNAFKTSIIGKTGRWSSTSIQMNTTNPRDLCGEDLIWWWTWGNRAALGWEKAERQEKGSGHLVYQDKIEKKFHGREQCHRNKKGEWWEKGVGLQKSCLFQGCYNREVSFDWKSRTRVLRSNIKGLNKPVFLITGNRLLLFTIQR